MFLSFLMLSGKTSFVFSSWKSFRMFCSAGPSLFHDKFQDVVKIEYKGQVKEFGHRWLRDHCRCSSCVDGRTFQRLFDTSTIDDHISTRNMEIDKKANALRVEWKDGHQSSFHLDWLNSVYSIESIESPFQPLMKYQTWRSGNFKTLPHVKYEEVMNNDQGLKDWISLIKSFGFGIVRGCPILQEGNTDPSRAVMERLGPLTSSFFEKGGVWDIKVESNTKQELEHADTAYTNLQLPPHVDGTYFSEPPGLQFFQIPYHDGKGGETILVDGFHVGEWFEQVHPELFDYLATFPMLFHYYEKGISLRNSSTVFTKEGNSFKKFSFNNNDRMPCYIPPNQERFHYDAIAILMKALNDPVNQMVFRLQPDEILVTNGWRVLHGRKAFTGTRRLVGAYTSMSDFLSTERLLGGPLPEVHSN